jgi:hypothetical protein
MGRDQSELILRKAIREVLLKLKEVAVESDPAPWFEIPVHEAEMWAEGNVQDYIRGKKLERRAICIVKSALLCGDLIAHFSDGKASLPVPGWAWQPVELRSSCWFEGYLPVDPFLPDEWYRWSGESVFVDSVALDGWLSTANLGAFAERPELPEPFDLSGKPTPTASRPPSQLSFVPLSEALSWIAFGVAMDSVRLGFALDGWGIDKNEAQKMVSDAVNRLTDCGTGGSILLRGKYVGDYLTDDRGIPTEVIDPTRLADFAQFDSLHDGLRFGNGLAWLNNDNSIERVLSHRQDAFRCVTVQRSDLMTQFPDCQNAAGIVLEAIPVSLPDVGQVMGLEEATCLIAFGTPSFDISVWQNAAGELAFFDPTGNAVTSSQDGVTPQHIERSIEANRKLHSALRDGSLASYIWPTNAQPLVVPRLYWNGIDPKNLPHVYRGMMSNHDGAGRPILLSRRAFNEWRASIPPISAPDSPRPKQSVRKPRMGRAKGTGYQAADAPLIEKMRNAIATDPALNATSAARQFASEAKGASFEAKVDRLSRAYRAGRNRE